LEKPGEAKSFRKKAILKKQVGEVLEKIENTKNSRRKTYLRGRKILKTIV